MDHEPGPPEHLSVGTEGRLLASSVPTGPSWASLQLTTDVPPFSPLCLYASVWAARVECHGLRALNHRHLLLTFLAAGLGLLEAPHPMASPRRVRVERGMGSGCAVWSLLT